LARPVDLINQTVMAATPSANERALWETPTVSDAFESLVLNVSSRC